MLHFSSCGAFFCSTFCGVIYTISHPHHDNDDSRDSKRRCFQTSYSNRCPLADDDRRTSIAITHRINAFCRHQQNAHDPLNDFLHISKTFYNAVLMIDQCRHQLRRIDDPAAGLQKCVAPLEKQRSRSSSKLLILPTVAISKRTKMRFYQ